MTQAFNLSQLANFVNTSGQLNAASGLYNQTQVANGGTGKSSVTAGAVLIGAGTSAMTEVPGTGTTQVLVSSPAGWSSAPIISASGGGYNAILYSGTSPGTYSVPSILKAVKVTVIGGGASAVNKGSPTPGTCISGGGGSGGAGIKLVIPRTDLLTAYPSGIIPISAGVAGVNSIVPGTTSGVSGGASSFGTFCSATGGVGAPFVGTPASLAPGGAAGTTTGVDIDIAYSASFWGTRAGVAYQPGSPNLGAGGTLGVFNNFYGLGAQTTTSPGTGYGSGGGGFQSPSTGVFRGGNGTAGVLLIEEFY